MHFFAAAYGIAERVNEDVILRHQLGEFVGVVLVDGIEKRENCFDRTHDV